MSYTIKYPQFISEMFERVLTKLNLLYKTKAFMYEKFNIMKLYQMAIEEYEYSVANGYPIRPYEAVMNYNVTYNQNCAISLYFDTYEYMGGAHGNTLRTADSWDLQKGKEIELSELFPNVNNVQDYIIKIINEQIANQIKDGSNQYFEDYSKLVTENFDINSFYLIEEGVVIYFQHYDIAPYASGIPTFTIPYFVGAATPPKCKKKLNK